MVVTSSTLHWEDNKLFSASHKLCSFTMKTIWVLQYKSGILNQFYLDLSCKYWLLKWNCIWKLLSKTKSSVPLDCSRQYIWFAADSSTTQAFSIRPSIFLSVFLSVCPSISFIYLSLSSKIFTLFIFHCLPLIESSFLDTFSMRGTALISVVYFDQLLGAACKQKLFLAIFNLFCWL